VWLTHLPSKNTLALVVTLTLSIFSVVMVLGCERYKTSDFRGQGCARVVVVDWTNKKPLRSGLCGD
jgi:hypothetical protein